MKNPQEFFTPLSKHHKRLKQNDEGSGLPSTWKGDPSQDKEKY